MADWPLIAVRWALYVDLGVLFGVPLFGLYALRAEERAKLLPFGTLIAALAVAGAVLSVAGFALTAAAMTGTGLGGLDRGALAMLLSETNMGWAFTVREIALILTLICTLLLIRWPVPLLTAATLLGAIAVASLAWSGHAAASEGNAGAVHLVADIVHLLAGSAWVGALFGFVGLIVSKDASRERLRTSRRALAGFATIGTIIVSLIVLTGVVNGIVLVGVENVASLTTSLYGQLLLVKLGLFACMLLHAASNRFRHTPALAAALENGGSAVAVSALRRSLVIEVVLGVAILALVAWLGTLAPPLSGG